MEQVETVSHASLHYVLVPLLGGKWFCQDVKSTMRNLIYNCIIKYAPKLNKALNCLY